MDQKLFYDQNYNNEILEGLMLSYGHISGYQKGNQHFELVQKLGHDDLFNSLKKWLKHIIEKYILPSYKYKVKYPIANKWDSD